MGEMTQAGMPVPPGFVVVAGAFDRFVEGAGLDRKIEEALAGVDVETSTTIDQASESIRQLILDASMPDDTREEIEMEFKTLGAELIAVRSSATAEDSSSASWAGELETYLNVTSENLIESVKLCWSSLFTPRAIFYRFEKGLDTQKVSVAVVVQKMVQSEVSGIAFTVHPVTEDYDRMIIEAGYGLGEAIVGGMITPDSYVIEKKSLGIEDKYISNQQMMIVRSPEGTSERTVPAEKQEIQKLADDEIKELAQICLNIERHYGFPCDIEWAFEAGKLYITQSRPITTLSSAGEANKNEEKHLFKKIESRSLSLTAIRVWYLSDRHGLEAHTGGTMFFEPLFIHEDGRGVSVYYDFTDPKQDPKHLLPYFFENMDKFVRLASEYESDCQEILRLISQGREADFKKVFDLVVRTWPMLAISDVVGAMEGEDKYRPLIKRAYELRVKHDTVVYKAEEFLLRIISESLGTHGADLAQYVLPEEFIEGAVPGIAILQQRKRRYVYFEGSLATDFDIESFCHERNINLERTDVLGTKESFTGTVAYKGKAVGRVVLVFEKSQVGKVEKGDILVTPMTTPDFLPAMKKAAAFVTDEGGATCHAAIIAREMGKPCIIGTKLATSVLKDGDLVEVDADNGRVDILERLVSSQDIEKELELFEMSKHVSYPFIPAICFESSSKGYVDNPYLAKYGAASGQNFVSLLDGTYEAWGDWSKRFLIKSSELANEVIGECDKFLYKNNPHIESLVNQEFHSLSPAEVNATLRELDSIITDLYHLYIFFIDECFEVDDDALNEKLPEVRMILSDCASRLYEGCDKVIEALSGLYPEIPWKAFTFATVEEIGRLTANPKEEISAFAKIENRPIVFVAINNRLRSFVGQEAAGVIAFIKNRDVVGELKEAAARQMSFSGTTAHKGSATGAVVVIKEADYKNAAEIIGHKKDYVLVTPMTRPEIMNIIKDAVAIITDEGGITCHAAIVARELKKPCIVGTKIATSILKSGDLVEVDADSGTVRILK